MIENSILHKVLTKFKFFTPLPNDVQAKIDTARYASLLKILKMKNSYSLTKHLIIFLFFSFRNKGLGFSLKSVQFMYRGLSFAAAGAIIVCGIYIGSLFVSKPDVLQGSIVFTSGDVRINDTIARTGNNIKIEDTITTNKKSFAIVRFNDAAQIIIEQDSMLKIKNLAMNNKKSLIEIFQGKGSTFNKIRKNKSDYLIHTRSAIAGVRGTSLYVSVISQQKTEISVVAGRITVMQPEDPKETLLIEKGQKIEATHSGISKPVQIPEKDLKRLTILNKIEIQKYDKENKKSIKTEYHIPEEVKDMLLPKEETKGNTQATMTLEEIKKKYGRLTKIVTISGKEYVGGFATNTDGSLKVQTIRGLITLKSNDIKQIIPYSN